MITTSWCPDCRVDLQDDGTRVWCWRCGWEARDVAECRTYHEYAEEIARAAVQNHGRIPH